MLAKSSGKNFVAVQYLSRPGSSTSSLLLSWEDFEVLPTLLLILNDQKHGTASSVSTPEVRRRMARAVRRGGSLKQVLSR